MEQLLGILQPSYLAAVVFGNMFLFMAMRQVRTKPFRIGNVEMFPEPKGHAKAWITMANSAILGLLFYIEFGDGSSHFVFELLVTYCFGVVMYDKLVKGMEKALNCLIDGTTSFPSDTIQPTDNNASSGLSDGEENLPR